MTRDIQHVLSEYSSVHRRRSHAARLPPDVYLWFDRALTRNLIVTLRRVMLGFLLACAVGIPLGVLAGCFAFAQGLLFPLTIFGRNIPLAALIPLTFAAF